MGTAGIGGDHSAEGGVFPAGGVGREEKPAAGQGGLQLSEAIARLTGEGLVVEVYLNQTVHVAGKIHQDAASKARPAEAAAGTPGMDRVPVCIRKCHCFDHVPHRSRVDNAGRHFLKNAAVRGEQVALQPVAKKVTLEAGFQF